MPYLFSLFSTPVCRVLWPFRGHFATLQILHFLIPILCIPRSAPRLRQTLRACLGPGTYSLPPARPSFLLHVRATTVIKLPHIHCSAGLAISFLVRHTLCWNSGTDTANHRRYLVCLQITGVFIFWNDDYSRTNQAVLRTAEGISLIFASSTLSFFARCLFVLSFSAARWGSPPPARCLVQSASVRELEVTHLSLHFHVACMRG